MELLEIEELKKQPINELNTIESIEAMDYINGKITAINHCYNKAILLSNKGKLDQQGITDLNQFCSDRILLFDNTLTDLDKGMHDGYLIVKLCISQ